MFNAMHRDVLARELEKHVGIELDPKSSPKDNKLGAKWLSHLDISKVSWPVWGRVVDAVAYLQIYKVQLEENLTLWCSLGTTTGTQPWGAKQLNTLPLGAGVFVLLHPRSFTGTIICADPDYIVNPRDQRPDWISQASRCGITVDKCHKFPLDTAQAGNFTNFAANRPADSIHVGEYGAVTETGIMFFIDPFMAQMRVDEETGLFLFHYDSMARLAGHNLQIRTALSDKEEVDDQSEISSWHGKSYFFHEPLGVLNWNEIAGSVTPYRSYTTDQVHRSTQEYADLEPKFDDQQSYYRLTEYDGYLGQIHKRTLSAPPPAFHRTLEVLLGYLDEESANQIRSDIDNVSTALKSEPGLYQSFANTTVANAVIALDEGADWSNFLASEAPALHSQLSNDLTAAFDELSEEETAEVSSQTINRFKHKHKYVGLFSEDLLPTGEYSIRTAKSLILAKRPVIPIPKQIKRPEDANGDNNLNYKAAGIYGDGVDHVVKSDLTIPDATSAPRSLVKAASFLDAMAFTFNWKEPLAFHYHSRDWYLPQEDEGSILYLNMELPEFRSLNTEHYLAAPTPAQVNIDNRYGDVNYYPNESFFTLLDDGGFILADAYGTEIKATGGNLYISCPGDMYFQPGKTAVTMAGWDIVHKAYNSIDLTATRKDVRIKAEHNVMVLGGNDECGGILLESKAKCPVYEYTDKVGETVITSGIVMKAERSYIMGLGKKIILETTKDNNINGDIILDANRNKIKEYGKHIERFAKKSFVDYFTTGGAIRANEWWRDRAIISSDVSIDGTLNVSKCLRVNSWIFVKNGHIATSLAKRYKSTIPLLDGINRKQLIGSFNLLSDRIDRQDDIGEKQYDEDFLEQVEDWWEEIEFSLRIPSQYRTARNYFLFENRWQQLARLNSEEMPVWNEKAVLYNQSKWSQTFPYPGREPTTGVKDSDGSISPSTPATRAWKTIDLNLVDVPNGVDRDRSVALYGTPPSESVTSHTLQNSYTIIRDS